MTLSLSAFKFDIFKAIDDADVTPQVVVDIAFNI